MAGAALLLLATPALAAGPRVASATVCADQYVLKLADRDQIAALSPDAADPRLSLLAAEGAAFPRPRPAAETYLLLGVEVLITNAWSDAQTAAMLERFGVRVVRIPLIDDLNALPAIDAEVAAALGHPERGPALSTATRAALEQAVARGAGRGREGLYLRPDGGTAGAGTYVDAVMTTTGLHNQAAAQGLKGWASYGLERFVMHPPSLMVLSFFAGAPRSVGGAFGAHPAFRARAGSLPAVTVPGAAWACGGWILGPAANILSDGLEALSPPVVAEAQP